MKTRKKKLIVGTISLLLMMFLLTSTVLAAIPSHKTSSGSFEGYTATAYGEISSSYGYVLTGYSTTAWSIYGAVRVGYYLSGTYKTSSTHSVSDSNAGAVEYLYGPGTGTNVVDCHTWHRVGYNDTLWSRQLDYTSSRGSWVVS